MSGSGCWEEQSSTDDWREGEREGRREGRGGRKQKGRERREGWEEGE